MQTQLGRPSLSEAFQEAIHSQDTHWTASLSKMGMTRINANTIIRVYSGPGPRICPL